MILTKILAGLLYNPNSSLESLQIATMPTKTFCYLRSAPKHPARPSKMLTNIFWRLWFTPNNTESFHATYQNFLLPPVRPKTSYKAFRDAYQHLLTPLVHPQQYRVLPWCLPKSFWRLWFTPNNTESFRDAYQNPFDASSSPPTIPSPSVMLTKILCGLRSTPSRGLFKCRDLKAKQMTLLEKETRVLLTHFRICTSFIKSFSRLPASAVYETLPEHLAK